MVEPDGAARRRIKVQHDTVKTFEQDLAALQQQLRDAQEATQTLWDSMSLRERYLRGWLGGDRQNAKQYKELQASKLCTKIRINECGPKLQAAKERLTSLLEQILRTDPAYAALSSICTNGERALAASRHLIVLAAAALDAVRIAQTYNTLDAVGVNGTSALDYTYSVQAQEKLQTILNYLPHFQKTIRSFLTARSTGSEVSQLNSLLAALDLADLAVDTPLDLLQINELSQAEQEVQRLLITTKQTLNMIECILEPLTPRRQQAQDHLLESILA